jgi:hypothetical protein
VAVIDLARAAGRLVGVPLAALARRRRGKPMHPRGAVYRARLDRTGARPPSGVPWMDGTGTEPAVVRLSRGAGLPARCPDLLGLAVRVTGGPDPVDLLLSTSGSGPLGRLVPRLRRDAATFHSSLMAYRSDAGPLRVAAAPVGPLGLPSEPRAQAAAVGGKGRVYVLAVARGREEWRPFARLLLLEPVGDPDVRFDAVRHPPPGLVADGPMARFRAPAYARAQAARRAPGAQLTGRR